MKRLQDKSDVPRARHGILPKIHTSSKKNTKLHSTRPRKNGYSRLRQQKSPRKESLWWIPERVCMWSTKKTLTLLSGDHEDINESDDGDDGQRRSANKRRSNGVCQRIGPIRDSYAS